MGERGLNSSTQPGSYGPNRPRLVRRLSLPLRAPCLWPVATDKQQNSETEICGVWLVIIVVGVCNHGADSRYHLFMRVSPRSNSHCYTVHEEVLHSAASVGCG